ncbi:MAG TPA: hypothetical protein VFQ60_01610 [Patescibacteria group bacterium]|nr:hypothetical protein [Patescibacteria group bacterium]
MEETVSSSALSIARFPISQAPGFFSGVQQERLVAVLIEIEERFHEERRVAVITWDPEQVPTDRASAYTIAPFLPDRELYAMVRGYFAFPGDSVHAITGSQGLARVRSRDLHELCDGFSLIKDCRGAQARRIHLLSTLEETRFRFTTRDGNSFSYRWSLPVAIQGPHALVKQETVLLLDVNESCGRAFGLISPTHERHYPIFASHELGANRTLATIEHVGSWEPRTYSALGVPFTDGSRVRRFETHVAAVMTSHRDGARVLVLTDQGDVRWSRSFWKDGRSLIGRCFLPSGAGLIVSSADKLSFTVVPSAAYASYFSEPEFFSGTEFLLDAYL